MPATTNARPSDAPAAIRLSPDWLATLLAGVLAALAWGGLLPHVGW